MRAAIRILVSTALGILILSAPLRRLAPAQPAGDVAHAAAARTIHPARFDPTDVSLREAAYCQAQAMQVVGDDLASWEEWDPNAPVATNKGAWRHELSRDRSGYLARARSLAQRGLSQARSPGQMGRALRMLAKLSCFAGDHRSELRYAERAALLLPDDSEVRNTLHNAPICRGGGGVYLTEGADPRAERPLRP